MSTYVNDWSHFMHNDDAIDVSITSFPQIAVAIISSNAEIRHPCQYLQAFVQVKLVVKITEIIWRELSHFYPLCADDPRNEPLAHLYMSRLRPPPSDSYGLTSRDDSRLLDPSNFTSFWKDVKLKVLFSLLCPYAGWQFPRWRLGYLRPYP